MTKKKARCVVGRTLTSTVRHGTLDWQTPCASPVTESLPFDPPWPLCAAHYQVLADTLYEKMLPQIEEQGFIVGPL